MFDNIEIVVALWEHVGFRGRRVLLTEDTPRLSSFGFNDIASSVGIHPGPDFDEGKRYEVSLYQHAGFGGQQLVLEPGAYPSLHSPFNFGDRVSSVRIGQGIAPAPRITPIPVVVEVFEHVNFVGRKLLVVEDISNIHSYANFGDQISSVRVHRGPDFANGDKAKLYRHVRFQGGQIDLDPGSYPNLHQSHGFGDVVSSIRVR